MRKAEREKIRKLWWKSILPGSSPSKTVKSTTKGVRACGGMLLRAHTLKGRDTDPAPDFELLEMLGEGGIGVVYASRQTSCDRFVAVKMLRPALADNESSRNELLREAAATAYLDHPNIVPVYEVGASQDGDVFYAMKKVEGTPWSSVISTMGREDNLEVLLRVCDAVSFAHSRGVIHRDIKPENVMLGEYGEVLLMDWGLAAAVAERGKGEHLGPDSLVAGSPAYMPPEMAQGEYEKIGFASDTYLLGAILYEILAGHPPHKGDDPIHCLYAAAENEIVTTVVIDELLDIALHAMATEPHLRFGSAKAFGQAVRDYRVHAESIQLTHHAEDLSRTAVQQESYSIFGEAVSTFLQALKLWNANEAAERGLRIARYSYAACACEKKDLDLAHALLEESGMLETKLGRKVNALKRERANAAKAEHRRWHVMFDDNFTDENVSERWEILGAKEWEVRGGQLRLSGGKPMWAVVRRPFWGDIRLSFDCRQESDMLCDVTGVVGGYQFKYGGWSNTISAVIAPDGEIIWSKAHSPLVKSKVHRALFEKAGKRLRMTVDGQIEADVEDSAMGERELTDVFVLPFDRVALFGYLTDSWYTNVKVEMLGAPEKADLLQTAERFFTSGRYATALDLFQEIMASTTDSSRLARAHEGIRRAENSLEVWRRTEEAQKHVDKVSEKLRGRFGRKTPLPKVTSYGLELNVDNWDLHELPRLHDLPLGSLRCGICFLRSLEPLRGMRLLHLRCEINRLSDIGPVYGMPLGVLSFGYNQVSSLEPLKGMMSLKELHCHCNRITSLEPLRGLPLTVFFCHDNGIASLEPLRGMPLVTLCCLCNSIEDLGPLETSPNLRNVWAGWNAISDLAPLRAMKLRSVGIEANGVASLQPLCGMPLEALDCKDNLIADLTPLREMLLLKSLRCQGNSLTTLEPLRGIGLRYLDCSNNPLPDLGPFVEAPPDVFLFDCPTIPDSHLDSARKHWAGNGATSRHALHAATLLAVRSGDVRTLKRLALEHGAHRYLLIPKSVKWEEAKALAESLGGHVVTIGSPQENEIVRSLVPGQDCMLWIGLRETEHGPEWVTGEPAGYENWHVFERPTAGDQPLAILYTSDRGRAPGCAVMAALTGRWAAPLAGVRFQAPFVMQWDE